MISFIHRGGPGMASYRYRAEIPAFELGASINDLTADVLVFAKPAAEEVSEAHAAQADGKTVIVDFCDYHFDQPHYGEFYDLADAVTAPTQVMALWVRRDKDVTVIPDPYEFTELLPHCHGNNVLWFGHGTNFKSLLLWLPKLFCPLKVVSNLPLAMPWSIETMYREFLWADIVIIPKTAEYKSPNRAVEAIRQGCFVVAEPHPSLIDFPGIWIGDIAEGIEWASQNQSQANEKTRAAQLYVREKYSPKTQAFAWKTLFERVKSRSTSVAGRISGRAGSASIPTIVQMSAATCGS